MAVKKRPDQLPRHFIQNKLKGGMLNGRVMAGFVNRLGDGVAADTRPLVFRNIARVDDLRRITGAGGGDGVVIRILESVFENNDGFGREGCSLGYHPKRSGSSWSELIRTTSL